jgi:uncharacterized membrane protein (DUF373 family)
MRKRRRAGGTAMKVKEELAAARRSWKPLTFYQKFEQVCILFLNAVIALIVVLAIWNLALKVILLLINSSLDPTDYEVFQTIFGMLFTVIIALEFKRSLLGLAERQNSIIQVRSVVLLALIALVRKLIILDPHVEAGLLAALAATTLALGMTYWLVSRTAGQSGGVRSDALRQE